MFQLVLFLAIAVALFASIYLMARNGARAEGGAEALLEARQALTSLQSGLLPSELIERIFAKDDFEFIGANASASVQRLFYAERKKIARSWVAQLRSQIVSLRQFHSGSARFYAQLSFTTEVRLLLDFQRLLWLCRTLDIALQVTGPDAAHRMVASTATVAARICTVSEKSMGFLTSSAATMRNNSSGQAAV